MTEHKKLSTNILVVVKVVPGFRWKVYIFSQFMMPYSEIFDKKHNMRSSN